MTKIFIDSNIFLYHATSDDPHHKASILLLNSLVYNHHLGLISPYVINEVHYINIKKIGYQKAKTVILNIFEIPRIQLIDLILSTQDIKSICRISSKYKLKTSDSYHAYYCKKLNIKTIATFDTDFDKLPWL